jgi:hypothetical protein
LIPSATPVDQYVQFETWNISRIANGAMLTGTGPPCWIGGTYWASIEFICDPTATTPTLVNTMDDYRCVAKFQMKTNVSWDYSGG